VTWEDVPGWVDYCGVYDELVARTDQGVIVEVGAYLGRSLCYLGQKVKESGKPITVVGVDWCLGSGVENGHDNHADALASYGGSLAGKLHRNVVDCGLADVVSILVAESGRAASLFADESLAAVFLDARHDYESVVRDIFLWQPRVMRGGVLCGDDVGIPGEANPVWPDVKRALNDTIRGWVYKPHDAWWYLKT
jgi:predicted O-methyltransferase YrrM